MVSSGAVEHGLWISVGVAESPRARAGHGRSATARLLPDRPVDAASEGGQHIALLLLRAVPRRDLPGLRCGAGASVGAAPVGRWSSRVPWRNRADHTPTPVLAEPSTTAPVVMSKRSGTGTRRCRPRAHLRPASSRRAGRCRRRRAPHRRARPPPPACPPRRPRPTRPRPAERSRRTAARPRGHLSARVAAGRGRLLRADRPRFRHGPPGMSRSRCTQTRGDA